jgi:alpha-methylacyl-CoA racemase
MNGPLQGLRVIEFAGLGPVPFAGMMLADMGAQVLRIERPGFDPQHTSPLQPPLAWDVLARGRRVLPLNLREPQIVDAALAIIERCDVLLEGFRPGVMERLGLAPDVCLARRPALVYGRMTGWGRDGPLAHAAGHDINYLALSGLLGMIGPADATPVPPLNLVADFGGGGMLLAFGVMCALHEARTSGRGQLVDAAMLDGCALLGAMFSGFRAAGLWPGARGDNLLDGGAPMYNTYRCADGRCVAVGALEPAFAALLRERLGLAGDPLFDDMLGRAAWPAQKERLTALFATRSRDEWCMLLEGSDACFAPVLDPLEAPAHPQHEVRQTFVDVGGIVQPSPAPRLDRTPAARPQAATAEAAQVRRCLIEWGVSDAACETLMPGLET